MLFAIAESMPDGFCDCHGDNDGFFDGAALEVGKLRQAW